MIPLNKHIGKMVEPALSAGHLTSPCRSRLLLFIMIWETEFSPKQSDPVLQK